ncbi:outer membrane protein assembly factor BamE [Methylobacillus flagellatus]|uniref:outer membrane protein assembly factor BamE n=1 Tax=Methylobacillus flagellatus TaxID=405 RepID=UPI0025711373|nr:outer membrane protein assembly factor BamE [Methylobacillus flagellatus]
MRQILLLLALLCVGCDFSLPKAIKPYRLDVQQGNVITSKMLLQLKPGMTKSQVRFIMGTPLIQDSFHSNRWDYFYQFRKDGKVVEQRLVIMEFDDDGLRRIRGDVVPSAVPEAGATNAPEKSALPEEQEKSLSEKLKFWKSDKPEVQAPQAAPAELVNPSEKSAPSAAAPETTAPAAPPASSVTAPATPAASAAPEVSPAPLNEPPAAQPAPASAAPVTPAATAPAAKEANPAAAKPAATESKPAAQEELPPEGEPGYFERMLEKIGF